MFVPELLKDIGEKVNVGATVRNVFGEPVTSGDRTVIPVARVSFGFGGGGGGAKNGASESARAGNGAGGGGGGTAIPVGYIEMTPLGTRFVQIPDWRRLAAVVSVGFAAGLFLGKKR